MVTPSNEDADGRAALALLETLLSALVDKGAIGSNDRNALIAATMDRLQRDADPKSLSALDALQRHFVAETHEQG